MNNTLTIYEKKNGTVECKYGESFEVIEGVIRQVTTTVSDEVMDFIKNTPSSRVNEVTRKLREILEYNFQ